MIQHSITRLVVTGNRLACTLPGHKELVLPCAVGKGGFSSEKKEGDGCTPLGSFPMRECWYRQDRLSMLKTRLPLRITNEEDGWCDEPSSPHYNQPVKLPYSLSHELMWRDDHVYDIVIPLGYNDDPVIPGRGSAIFMHLARENYEPTEGCIALLQADMLKILPFCGTDTLVDIRAA